AAFIVKDGFKLPEDGLYSGFDAATQVYDKSTWNYEEGGNVGGTYNAAEASETRKAATSPAQPAPAAANSQPSSEGGGQGPVGGGHQAAGGPGASAQSTPKPSPMLPPN